MTQNCSNVESSHHMTARWHSSWTHTTGALVLFHWTADPMPLNLLFCSILILTLSLPKLYHNIDYLTKVKCHRLRKPWIKQCHNHENLFQCLWWCMQLICSWSREDLQLIYSWSTFYSWSTVDQEMIYSDNRVSKVQDFRL